MKIILISVFIACLLTIPAHPAPSTSARESRLSLKAKGKQEQQNYVNLRVIGRGMVAFDVDYKFIKVPGVPIHKVWGIILDGGQKGQKCFMPSNATKIDLRASNAMNGKEIFSVRMDAPPNKTYEVSADYEKGIFTYKVLNP